MSYVIAGYVATFGTLGLYALRIVWRTRKASERKP
jgi:hypothetical protein